MKTEEKQAFLTKGEEVLQTGREFVVKLNEWSKMVTGFENIIDETKDDPDFQKLDEKFVELSNQIESNF